MDWPYRQSIAPMVQTQVMFGDVIQLRGFDAQMAGDQLNLNIYWESITAVSPSYKVFIHLLDGAGNIVAQVDRPPVNGLAPTHRWQPGDLVRDPYQIALPPDLPAGTYELRAGLYTDENGRLPISGGRAVENAAVLTSVEIGD